MSYILVGSEDNILTAYPFEKLHRVDYQHNKSGETESDENHIVSVHLYIGRSSVVVYNEKGDASIVEPGQAIYRKVLSGIESGKPVNLTDFASTEPKKVPAKKAPAKKPEPEALAEQPSES